MRQDVWQQAMQRCIDRAEPELTSRVFVVGEDLQVGEFTQQTPRLRDDPAACRRDRYRPARARSGAPNSRSSGRICCATAAGVSQVEREFGH